MPQNTITAQNTTTAQNTITAQNAPLQGLVLQCPPAFVVNTTATIEALVESGIGINFIFTINSTSNSAYDIAHLIHELHIVSRRIRSRSSGQLQRKDTVYEVTPHRQTRGVFYPGDIVGIALKVKTSYYSSLRPTSPSCIVDWGDNKGKFTFDDVDLTPSPSTLYIYTVNYSYSQVGTFTASALCLNRVSQVQGNAQFQVVSPVTHATAVVLMNPVPFSVSGGVNGSIKIAQNYLKNYSNSLLVTVDFGINSSTTSLIYSGGSQIITYQYKERGNFPVTVTFEAFSITSIVNLNIQIGVLFDVNEISHRKMIRINELTSFKVFVYLGSYLSFVSFKVPLRSITHINSDNVVVDTCYASVGNTSVSASVLWNGTNEKIYFDFGVYEPCISTIYFFEKVYTVIETPLRVWLSTLPKISGRAERTPACNESDWFNMTWQVWRNTGTLQNLTWYDLDIKQPNAIIMDFTFIKTTGLYKIQLNISVTGKMEKESDTMYLDVSPAPLEAEISKGVFRQVKIGSILKLDAVTESYDPPLSPGDESNLTFFWSCYKLSQKEEIVRYALPYYHNDTSYRQLPKCNISSFQSIQSKGLLSINTTPFIDKDLILFEVVVSKDSRSEKATQTVEFFNVQPAEVVISCVWNCEKKLNPGFRMVYTADITCPGCRSSDIYQARYRWSVYKYYPQLFSSIEVQANFWQTNISSDRNSSRFDTDGLWLEEGTTYTIVVDVNVSTCVETRAMKVVYTNIKPYNGDFGLYRGSFDDNHESLCLSYPSGEISAPVILSFNSTTPYNCSFSANIIDIYGYRVNYTSNFWIDPNYQLSVISDTQTSSDLKKSLESVLNLNDPIKIAKAVASLLTSVTSQMANTLVEIVGSVIKNFNASTPAEIQMFANLMSKLTKDKKKMTSNSMEMASGSILHLTNNLQRIGAKLPDLHPCLEDVTDVIQNIINYQTIDTDEFYSQARQKAVDMGLRDLETQSFIQTEYQKMQLQTFNKLEQIDSIINDVTSTWDYLLKIFHKMEDSFGKFNMSKQGYTIATQKSNVDVIRERTDFTSPLGFKFNDVDVGGDLFAPLFIRAIKSKNIFIQGSYSKLVNSDIIIASVADKKGNKLSFSSPKFIHEIGESNCSKQESLSLITSAFVHGDASEMFYHQFAYSTVKDWVTDMCKLTKENGKLVCSCEGGKEVISGVSFNFEPNKIHFSTVFSKFDIQTQGLAFGVFVGLYFIFIVLFFWAHYMDKKGIFQRGVFPLADNFAEDTYFYLITVHTGLRWSAGTKSNVYFCQYGQDDETDIRKLSDGIKDNFPTGSVCHFVMACPNCLGDLQCMKIWHDNSGKGSEATWYLDRIDIVDLQTGRVCYFICEEWLAAENTLETTIEATGVEDLETLKSLFISNTKERLTDDHMWFSVFMRPQNSPFSQVERVGCCFAFLFLAMITSAMFYTGVPEKSRKQPRDDFKVGPLRIGFQQVIVISFLLALIVRKIKLKGLEQLDLSLVSQVNKEYGLKEKNCTILNIKLKNCVPSFSSGKEETRDYCLGWNFQPCSEFEKVNSLSSRAWTYTPAEDIQGLPTAGNYDIYNGGGYITNMTINTKVTQAILKELRTNYWIDHETRAVFIEFTLYSPNINHFAHIILLLEFNEMGGLIPFVSVYPISVHNPPGLLGSFVQFCQLIGIALTILGAIYVIFVLGKKKCSAFKDVWFLFELSAVIIAICTVTFFLLRLSYTKSILNKVQQDRNNYINFYHVVVWNSSYTLCLSLLVTIGYLRLLKLASYSEKTMKDTNVPLSDRWTTIVYFCLFVGIVVIFLTNYFLAVLMDLLVDKEKNYSKVESTKTFIVLWDSFLQVMGRKRHPTIRLKDSIKEDKSDSGVKAKSLDTDQTMLALEKNISRLLYVVMKK
ncbi:hypothetical protein Btru_073290 [Bulinus truncatus]|nr:hypothetical protein Btru_073290 [Bulinus truncatus]